MWRHARAGALIVLLCIGVVGCTPGPLIHPLTPASLGQSVELRKQVTVRYHGQTRSLQVALKVAPTDLTLIGLSPVGQRLFTLSWDGANAQVTSPLAGARRLPAKRILADLQLADWPLPALRQALVDPQMRLQQQGRLRTLWRGDNLLWLSYRDGDAGWNSPLMIYNSRGHYRLNIQPLALGGNAH